MVTVQTEQLLFMPSLNPVIKTSPVSGRTIDTDIRCRSNGMIHSKRKRVNFV